MEDVSRLAKLRHDLASPLSAILAEVQLLLMSDEALPPEVASSLRVVESQAIRMRTVLLDA